MQTQALLFAYFTANGEDGLHYSYSFDGLTFEQLNEGKSVLEPKVGSQSLMRDPFLMQGPDGLFRLLWTTGWQGQDIGYAESSDLIHWSEQRALPVMAHEAAAQNCWAPEMIFDEATSSYLIFWSTTILGKYNDKHRIFASSTKDFKSFSKPELFYDPGYVVIDANIVQDDETYLMFIKHERAGLVNGVELDSNAPGGEKAIHLAKSETLKGPYGLTGDAIIGESSGSYEDAAEGPAAIKLGDTWHLYFDYYRKDHYGLMTSTDLINWQNRTADLKMPAETRHGSIVKVSTEILEALKGLPKT